MEKSLNTLSDEQLIALENSHFSHAFEILVVRYTPFISAKASILSQYGVDRDELMQEGLMGLFRAVNHFDPVYEASFKTFAIHCIHNKMLSYLRFHNNNKSIPMKNYLSLSDEDVENFMVGGSRIYDPQLVYERNEDFSQSKKRMFASLSSKEQEILRLYLGGYSYEEIALSLDCIPKSVDNALQRIKKKFRSV